MKKALVLIMILLVAICVVACGSSTPAETTTVDTTAAITPGSTEDITPTTTTVTTTTIIPDSNPAVVTTAPAGEKVETVDYTAVLNSEKWTTSEADGIKFDIFGTGVDAVTKVNSKFGGYKKNYTLVNANGEKSEISNTEVRKLSTIGIVVAEDKENKIVNLEVHELEVKVLSSWSHVTAKAGSYLMFDITTNIPVEFATTVTAEEGGAYATAAYTQKDIYVTGENGKYVGTAKCQVPYAAGSTMYINICLDTSVPEAIISIPVVITPMRYESPFRLKIEGDWELINRKDYISDLIDLFYNVYPRIYARFGLDDPNVPMTITFKADKNSEAIAYNAGTLIAVQTGYANDAPYDIGFFAHELGHAIQQYGNKMAYESDSWWTEFMADYIRFRYFHWGYSTKFVKFFNYNDKDIYDWGTKLNGYAKHSHNLFGAYMDTMWPTVQNEDGTVTLGLIDTINKVIKDSKVLLYDHPKDKDNLFNKTIKSVTGYECMDDLRLAFAKEIQEGTWRCDGFADYQDTFVTEDIPGLPNPVYPMNKPVTKGDKTAPVLAAPVTEGNNIAKGATIIEASSQGGTRNPLAYLLDGDLTTMFQGAKVTEDYKYELGGYKHEFVLDLGASKTFDTYTIVNAGSKSSNKNNNTSEWEIFVSDDGENWTSVDYQKDISADIVSVNVGDIAARYVKIRVFNTDQSANVGTVRLYEFMLFDQQ